MTVRENYRPLLDSVNMATTWAEYMERSAKLDGYRDALKDAGHGWSGIEDDMYTKSKYGNDAEMCCGVLSRKWGE